MITVVHTVKFSTDNVIADMMMDCNGQTYPQIFTDFFSSPCHLQHLWMNFKTLAE